MLLFNKVVMARNTMVRKTKQMVVVTGEEFMPGWRSIKYGHFVMILMLMNFSVFFS